MAETLPERHIWCIYSKGNFATVSDKAGYMYR